LDFESILHTVIQKHSEVILTTFWTQLQQNKVFSPPGVVSLILDGMVLSTGAKWHLLKPVQQVPSFLMDALFRLRISVSRYSSRRRYHIYISYRPSLTWPSKRQITWASKVIEEEIFLKKAGFQQDSIIFVLTGLCRKPQTWTGRPWDPFHSTGQFPQSLPCARCDRRAIPICLNYHQHPNGIDVCKHGFGRYRVVGCKSYT